MDNTLKLTVVEENIKSIVNEVNDSNFTSYIDQWMPFIKYDLDEEFDLMDDEDDSDLEYSGDSFGNKIMITISKWNYNKSIDKIKVSITARTADKDYTKEVLFNR